MKLNSLFKGFATLTIFGLVMVSLHGLVGIEASAETAMVDQFTTYSYDILDDGTAEILHLLSYPSSDDELIIPSELDGYKVTSIGNFHVPDNFTSVIIPGSVTSIGDYAFYNSSNLINIEIPDSVTLIGDYAFHGCSSLASIEIPDSVTLIGDYAFHGCSSLTSITIPDNVTTIGNSVFCDCTSLTSVEIPYSVRAIGDYAFSGCSSLTSIDIPESIKTIGNHAFSYCDGIASITIPHTVDSIGACAFSGSSLQNIYIGEGGSNFISIDGVLYNDYTGELVLYPSGKSDESYSIVDGFTAISDEAFCFCYNLKEIFIPDSVTSIGKNAFGYCSYLSNINVDSANPAYTSVDGVLFSKDLKTIIACPVKNIETSYEIPDSVTSIGDYAFVGCFNLTSVTIPNSVTSIGDYAFELCTKLTSITIPDSVTSIGGWTFRGCNNLTSITIPESVTSISEYAFFECDNLTIYGYENSYAQTFAEENNIPFVVIEKQVQTIIAADVTFTYGESGKITATTNGDGVISYAITTGADVISVDDKGNIIALKAGTATVKITASQTTSYMAAEKTITVTVNANTTASVTIVPVTSPTESESITITTTITEESSATTATTSAPEESGAIITTTTTTTASGDTSTTTTTSFIITGIPSWVTTPAGTTTTTTTTTTTPTDDKDEVIDGTVVDDDTDTTTPADDTIEPQIKGENGKLGWEAIADEITDMDDGDTVIVDMNGATEVPKDIFGKIQGQDIDLVIELDNGFTWTINGESVTKLMDINLGVSEGADIPVKFINEVTGECEYITITLTHNGDFGFTATLTVDIGDENEGYFANLYWYTNGGMEFICADKIPSKGKADLTFTHASEYIIVIDEENHGKREYVSGVVDGIEEDEDEDRNPFTGVTPSFTGIIISAAVVMISRKIKNK